MSNHRVAGYNMAEGQNIMKLRDINTKQSRRNEDLCVKYWTLLGIDVENPQNLLRFIDYILYLLAFENVTTYVFVSIHFTRLACFWS